MYEAAEHSIGNREGATAARLEFRMLLEDYESGAVKLQEIMMLIESLVKQLLTAEKLMEIKGVGIKTGSDFWRKSVISAGSTIQSSFRSW